MERKSINTQKAPAAIGPYSQAIVVGDFIFCSGQIPLDPVSNELVGGDGDVEAQTRQVMENLAGVLEAAGSHLSHVVKTTIFITDIGDFEAVNRTYRTFFEVGTTPARSAVEVGALPKGARVEIEAIAVRS